jgi:hypothetical protein
VLELYAELILDMIPEEILGKEQLGFAEELGVQEGRDYFDRVRGRATQLVGWLVDHIL